MLKLNMNPKNTSDKGKARKLLKIEAAKSIEAVPDVPAPPTRADKGKGKASIDHQSPPPPTRADKGKGKVSIDGSDIRYQRLFLTFEYDGSRSRSTPTAKPINYTIYNNISTP